MYECLKDSEWISLTYINKNDMLYDIYKDTDVKRGAVIEPIKRSSYMKPLAEVHCLHELAASRKMSYIYNPELAIYELSFALDVEDATLVPTSFPVGPCVRMAKDGLSIEEVPTCIMHDPNQRIEFMSDYVRDIDI